MKNPKNLIQIIKKIAELNKNISFLKFNLNLFLNKQCLCYNGNNFNLQLSSNMKTNSIKQISKKQETKLKLNPLSIMKYFVVNKKQDSNLWIQKLTYFTWKEVILKYNTFLFKEKFEAWKYGPVLRRCYYFFKEFENDNNYDDGDLPKFFNTKGIKDISDAEKKKVIRILESTYDKFCQLGTWKIVQESHDMAWKKASTTTDLVIKKEYIKEDSN